MPIVPNNNDPSDPSNDPNQSINPYDEALDDDMGFFAGVNSWLFGDGDPNENVYDLNSNCINLFLV